MKNEIDDDRSKSIELLINNYRKLETFFKNAPEKIKIFNEEDSSSTSVDNHKIHHLKRIRTKKIALWKPRNNLMKFLY